MLVDTERSAMEILLNFQKLSCTCGGIRTLGTACPECGKRAPKGEVNRYVVQRREGLARVDALLVNENKPNRSAHGSDDVDSADVLINDLLTSLLAAISGFASAPASRASQLALAHALSRIDTSLRAALARARLRPQTGRWTAAADSIRHIEHVWAIYREVLATDNMAEAQSQGQLAQRILETVHTPMKAIEVEERLNTILDDDSRPIPERMLDALTVRFPDNSFLELPAIGASEAQQELGLATGPNSGLSYLLLQPISRTILNPSVFRSKIAYASAGLTNVGRLREVAIMDGAVQAVADTHRLMVEATTAFHAILAVETDERAIARRFGKLASEIYEASAPVLAWYRLVESDRIGPDAFAKVSGDDATKLAADLQKGPLAPVFDDAAKYLRHAPVHGRALDFDSDASAFKISLKSHSEVVPRDVFVDRVHAFLETILASTWSLGNAIELAGIDLTISAEDALYLGFTPLVLTALALPSIADLSVRDYQQTDSCWTFHIEGDVDLFNPALVAAGNAVGHADEVLLLGSTDEPLLTVRLEDANVWQRSAGAGHHFPMNFLALKAAARRDGATGLERSDVQFMLAALGIELLGGDMQTIVHLRRLRAWALEHGWTDEAALVNEVIASSRSGPAQDLTARLARLMQHAREPQPPASRAVRVLIPSAIQET